MEVDPLLYNGITVIMEVDLTLLHNNGIAVMEVDLTLGSHAFSSSQSPQQVSIPLTNSLE
jgi:hypothetical protein